MKRTPNVKDEPRPRPARLLRPSIAHATVSFHFAFGSRRRDGRGRWLWRLVGEYGPRHRLACEVCPRYVVSEVVRNQKVEDFRSRVTPTKPHVRSRTLCSARPTT